ALRCRRTIPGPAPRRPTRGAFPQRAAGAPNAKAGASVLAVIEHVVAAILGPAVLAMVAARRLLFAEAHRFDLVFLDPEEGEHLLQAVGAALAEADVVLAASALVGIALDQHLRARVLAQELGVRLDKRPVFLLDIDAVEIEIHRALRENVVRILERGERRAGRLARDVDPRNRLGLRAAGGGR